MNQAAKFWDKSADRYSKAPVRNQEAYQRKLEITRTYFTPDSEVFEFACGTGSTAIAHSPYVKRIVAIDISSRMLEIAQEKADAGKINNITFTQSTLEDFEAIPEIFDIAMAHSILHLIEDPEAASKRIYRMLKPGGIFVTSTFCLGDSSPIWRVVIPIARFIRVAPYVKILRRSELEQYIINAGFEIDHQSERNKKEAAFIIAIKPASETNT
jgi:ubiquinone/menaquinone biosynthesis C-methylase UbiE